MAVDKLVDSTQLDTDLTSVANAIRTKGGTSASLTFPTGFVNAIDAIPTGGGTEEAPLNDVNFIDYDGTILYSYSASEFAALESLPANPTHSGLTAQGWNWTLAEAKAQVASQGSCNIGQMYTTSDGKSRIYCSFDQAHLSFQLGVAPNGTVVVDWGDNSSTDTLTGTSLTTVKYAQHTYSEPGDYVIKLSATSGGFAFLGASQGSYLIRHPTSVNTDIFTWLSIIKKIEIGENASFGNNAFLNCIACQTITLPYDATSITTSAFQATRLLKAVVIPSNVTSIGSNALSGLMTLRAVSFPNSITSYTPSVATNGYSIQMFILPSGATNIPANMFQNCYSLQSTAIPSSTTSIGSNFYRDCVSLESFIVPASVTSIGTYAFYECFALKEIHFKPTTPPTVGGSNAWSNVPMTCKIYVPTGYLSAYTSATNYPSSSTYTYVEE